MAMLCLFLKVEAQSQIPNINTLKIGDTIPEVVWNMPMQVVNHPEGKKTITLNEYRGKLIILDFWATWCSSCISSMAHINPLKVSFKDNLTIIPITSESPDKVLGFLKTNPTLKPLNLLSVVSDSIINKIFPHQSLPHYIWISMDGRFLSQASADVINAGNIKKILKGNRPDWQEKMDIDISMPLFMGNSLPNDVKIKYYSILVEGRVSGLISGFGNSYSGKQKDLFYSNCSIKQIYEGIAVKLMRANGTIGSANKRIFFDLNSSDPSFNEMLFTYQYIGPLDKSESLYADALTNLNNVSGYYGRLERQKIKCLNLVIGKSIDMLLTKGGKSTNKKIGNSLQITNCSITTLINRLNDIIPDAPLIIDATSFKHNIDINLDLRSPNIDSLEAQLQVFGLHLDNTTEITNVFILSKNSNNSSHD